MFREYSDNIPFESSKQALAAPTIPRVQDWRDVYMYARVLLSRSTWWQVILPSLIQRCADISTVPVLKLRLRIKEGKTKRKRH